MNYAEMSDEQINHLVSDTLKIPRGDDWCNSWGDAGPIIQENMIGITAEWERCCEECNDSYHTGLWEVCVYDTDHNEYYEFTGKGPLRAAMIVFLMMKGIES